MHWNWKSFLSFQIWFLWIISEATWSHPQTMRRFAVCRVCSSKRCPGGWWTSSRIGILHSTPCARCRTRVCWLWRYFCSSVLCWSLAAWMKHLMNYARYKEVGGGTKAVFAVNESMMCTVVFSGVGAPTMMVMRSRSGLLMLLFATLNSHFLRQNGSSVVQTGTPHHQEGWEQGWWCWPGRTATARARAEILQAVWTPWDLPKSGRGFFGSWGNSGSFWWSWGNGNERNRREPDWKHASTFDKPSQELVVLKDTSSCMGSLEATWGLGPSLWQQSEWSEGCDRHTFRASLQS